MAGIITAPIAAVSAGTVHEMAPKRTHPATAKSPRSPKYWADEVGKGGFSMDDGDVVLAEEISKA